ISHPFRKTASIRRIRRDRQWTGLLEWTAHPLPRRSHANHSRPLADHNERLAGDLAQRFAALSDPRLAAGGAVAARACGLAATAPGSRLRADAEPAAPRIPLLDVDRADLLAGRRIALPRSARRLVPGLPERRCIRLGLSGLEPAAAHRAARRVVLLDAPPAASPPRVPLDPSHASLVD